MRLGIIVFPGCVLSDDMDAGASGVKERRVFTPRQTSTEPNLSQRKMNYLTTVLASAYVLVISGSVPTRQLI
jgi:hypothetical protein